MDLHVTLDREMLTYIYLQIFVKTLFTDRYRCILTMFSYIFSMRLHEFLVETQRNCKDYRKCHVTNPAHLSIPHPVKHLRYGVLCTSEEKKREISFPSLK
jgi:hypothetical protein